MDFAVFCVLPSLYRAAPRRAGRAVPCRAVPRLSQFYLVSPVFIALYMWKPLWGMVATLCALVASTSAMAIGTLSRDWSALALEGSWFVKYSEVRCGASLLVQSYSTVDSPPSPE